jgi:hypothetical protein
MVTVIQRFRFVHLVISRDRPNQPDNALHDVRRGDGRRAERGLVG